MFIKFRLLFALFFAITLVVSCSKEEFEISSKTDELSHVKNGDYLIPVLVRGNTASKKIILYVQGGPALNTLDFATVDYAGWKNTLEKEYAVAYYDQRGMGNRQGNFGQGENVIDTWVEDLHMVAMFLQKAYNAEVIMLGHSFGGGLMYRYMLEKGTEGIPTKYIALNAPVTTDISSENLRWQFRREFLLNTANLEISRGNNVEKWQEALGWLEATPVIKKLEGDKPYQLFDQWNAYVEEMVYAYYGEKDIKARDYFKAIFASPYNPLPALVGYGYREDIAGRILQEEEEFGLIDKIVGIDHQSVLLLTGRYDDICVPEEMNYVFDQITSPLKQMEIIDNAGHESYNHQPAMFNALIKEFIQ